MMHFAISDNQTMNKRSVRYTCTYFPTHRPSKLKCGKTLRAAVASSL